MNANVSLNLSGPITQPKIAPSNANPDSKGKKIVVIMPAYKAADTIAWVLNRIPKPVYDNLFKILIVEDGGEGVPRSTSQALLDYFPKIEVLYHDKNRGYGGAQKSGYKRALELGADLCVLLHSDGQYAPEIMAELYRPIVDAKADIILGSRMKSWRSAYRGGMPFYKVIANIILSKIENLAYGMNLSEYHSGYMLYSKRALETIPFEKLSNTFHFDGEMLLMGGKKGLKVLDLPIPTFYGDEESHLKPIQYGFEVLGVILKYLRGKYNF